MMVTKDKKKLARVIATWVVTSVMLSVFILDIVVVSLANKYVSQVNIEDHNFNNISGDDKIHFLDTANSDCILIESNGHYLFFHEKMQPFQNDGGFTYDFWCSERH